METSEFNYFLPTRMVFGNGSLNKLYGLPEIAGHNCMLLCFPGFQGEQVVAQLKRVCRSLSVYDRFQENPGYAFVKAMAAEVRAREIDTIVAIGGGSCIDAAKVAAWDW